MQTQDTDHLIIRYNISVYTQAGWRGEVVTARAVRISDRCCEVVEVTDIGGNGNSGYASRTGANRQQYNVGAAAKREIGKTKMTSRLLDIQEVEHAG